VVDKLQKRVSIIDIAVPSDCKKETEKIKKYKDLSIELPSLWK